jgi:hypothetical protein
VCAEAKRAARSPVRESATFATRQGSTKAVQMTVPKFVGKESDSLVFWIREIELSAGHIYDPRSQVAFALSNIGGQAWGHGS